MYVAEPPTASFTDPKGVSIESRAREPTTRTLKWVSGALWGVLEEGCLEMYGKGG
jgi:hypothetical protein